MNLQGITAGIISAVNPRIAMVVQVSTGYVTDADGTQSPQYSPLEIDGDVQALSGSDIQRLNGLNIQGVTQKAYLNGKFEGVFRIMGKGGDLLQFDGRTYLVNTVMERWPDWVCVGITMQLDGQ
jgi:hypothetical protein